MHLLVWTDKGDTVFVSTSALRYFVPLLYLVYLPLHTQHRLLSRYKPYLKTLGYAFGHETIGDVL